MEPDSSMNSAKLSALFPRLFDTVLGILRSTFIQKPGAVLWWLCMGRDASKHTPLEVTRVLNMHWSRGRMEALIIAFEQARCIAFMGSRARDVWKSFLFPFINSWFGVRLFICILLSDKDCKWNSGLWNGSSFNQMLMDACWSLEVSGSSAVVGVIISVCEMQGSPKYGAELGMSEIGFLSQDPFLVLLTKVSPSAIVEGCFFLILWSTGRPGVECLVLQIFPCDERRWQKQFGQK